MNRNKVRNTANRKLGRFLYRARVKSRESLSQIANSLGLSEDALRSMEERPAEVPCRELYRLLEHYGPKRMLEAQLVLFEVQSSFFTASRPRWVGPPSRTNEREAHRWPRWVENFLPVVVERLRPDLLKNLFRAVFSG